MEKSFEIPYSVFDIDYWFLILPLVTVPSPVMQFIRRKEGSEDFRSFRIQLQPIGSSHGIDRHPSDKKPNHLLLAHEDFCRLRSSSDSHVATVDADRTCPYFGPEGEDLGRIHASCDEPFLEYRNQLR